MYEGAVQELIDELGRLPGIGPKSAQRIAFHILDADAEDMTRLAASIQLVKEKVRFCEICFNISEQDTCGICRDERRDTSQICIVEESKDVLAIERTRAFNGKYHVLGGSINPIAGIGPEQLHIRELVARLGDSSITELILATDPNLEGEATAIYLVRQLSPLGIKITRLASGLPVGGDLNTPMKSPWHALSKGGATPLRRVLRTVKINSKIFLHYSPANPALSRAGLSDDCALKHIG